MLYMNGQVKETKMLFIGKDLLKLASFQTDQWTLSMRNGNDFVIIQALNKR